MTTRIALQHRTTYRFDRTVNLGPHIVRLRPAPHSRTPISAYSLRVAPAEHFLNWQQDPFGNYEARLVFPEPATELDIVVDLVADMTAINPFDFFLDEETETYPFTYPDDLAADLTPYLASGSTDPAVEAWAADLDLSPTRTIDFLVEVNRRLRDDVDYTTRIEPGVQTPAETLDLALGSCRDSSWLLVHILRHLGLAARFVSGYLVQLTPDPPPAGSAEEPTGPTEDFTDLHAWAEVFLPGAGWVGLDPTSGLFAAEGHIPLAATPSPTSAAPVTGMVDESEVEFSYVNAVERIQDDPRVTKPYRAEQWEAVQALGAKVDEQLRRGDVRLTMGGEPTFVSVADQESEEWHTVADGPGKRRLAAALMDRLRDRFGPGGVIHHGQGKWYPGEPLPRWQRALVWRTDGEPVWHRPELLAEPDAPGDADYEAAEGFVRSLAERLGLGPTSTVEGAYEDPLHQLWQEALLPAGPVPDDDLDPDDPELFEERSRRALAARLEATRTGRPAGWVLPLFPDRPGAEDPRWSTTTWTTRRPRLFLLPGDSPVGYRLPIRSLAWTDPPPPFEPSPFAQLRPLPPADRWTPLRPEPGAAPVEEARAADRRPGAGPGGGAGVGSVDAEGLPPAVAMDGPPTALCAEVRNGQLHVFLPPLEHPSDAIDLLGAIEATAAELDQPVVIEGYPIPGDARLQRLVVAPDPGVVEVNVHPTTDWDELRAVVEGLYADAAAVGLGTEKFDLDGTHTGTGGGNHITLGGATPADSPLLRRPALLRSLLTYWQHHPALSYVFSSRFIGPSSQAPRVDEARDDSVYELETAFAHLEEAGDDGPPWLVDRLLRNLLTDQTGNTHRAEFCIDKLFSPDGERGRLGLLELRAFEMPPHPEMAMVQGLLVRSIVARCWDDPYHHDLVRWGTGLHDRYLLPWYLERDLHQVAADLDSHGISFDPAWFDPFVEFRFPRFGSTTVEDVTLELRGAIEPWHVLGEESTSSGMARYVDSSTERLQIAVSGAAGDRYVVTCNGVTLPLASTDVAGTQVAGVRYKAWQPASALHPAAPVDSPLTFDVFDRWTGRSLGGCRYHVTHPGGLLFDQRPVNAAVAESRRRSRFEPIGHSPTVAVPDLDRPHHHRELPTTLDLRRHASAPS